MDPVNVTGLELTGQGNNTSFAGVDAHFDWRLNSPTRGYDIGNETWGAQIGTDDPYFQCFEVSILDPQDSNRVKWTENVKTPSYVFTFAKNQAAFAGVAHYLFLIQVVAIDTYNNRSAPATLTVENPPPAPPNSIQVISGFRTAFVSWKERPRHRHRPHRGVGANTANDLPSATLLGTVAFPSTMWSDTGLTTNQDYWYWLRSVDTFGTPSAFYPPGDGAHTITGEVSPTDLGTFALTASQMWTAAVILQGRYLVRSHPDPDEHPVERSHALLPREGLRDREWQHGPPVRLVEGTHVQPGWHRGEPG